MRDMGEPSYLRCRY